MKKLFLILTLAVFALAGCTSMGGLDMSETAGPPGGPPGPWKRGVDGSGNKQIEADLDNDGTAAATIVDDGSGDVTIEGDATISGSLSVGVTALGSIASGTVTLTPGVYTITVAGDQTWEFDGWPAAGTEGKITVYVTNGGSATITGMATPIFSSGGEPALTAAGKDVLVFTSVDGGTTIYGFLTGLDVK